MSTNGTVLVLERLGQFGQKLLERVERKDPSFIVQSFGDPWRMVLRSFVLMQLTHKRRNVDLMHLYLVVETKTLFLTSQTLQQ